MKVLVVAPHADDEVLGCGGTISRHVEEKDEVHVIVASVSEVLIDGKLKSSRDNRSQELRRACEVLGVAESKILFNEYENELDVVKQRSIIDCLQADMQNNSYARVFIPSVSHHQDHRALNDACLAALRPGAMRERPQLIAEYEYPYTAWCQKNGPESGYFYVDISRHLSNKISAWNCYTSQKQSDNHPCSAQAIETLARMRGFEVGHTYSERFKVIQMTA